MISWWWLLIAAPIALGIGYLLGISAFMRKFKESLDKPDSPLRKVLDPFVSGTLTMASAQAFDTAAQVAEAHQTVMKCPQNCGTTIAQGMRETVIKQSLKGV